MCEAGGGGYSVRGWAGVCYRDTERGNPYLLISEGHIHTAYRWEYDPRASKCWQSSRVSLNIILLRICTPFCTLDVWQGLIRVVVLHLLSRGTNFHSNKHSRNCTQYGLVSLRKVKRLARNEPVRLTSRIHAHVICFSLVSLF